MMWVGVIYRIFVGTMIRRARKKRTVLQLLVLQKKPEWNSAIAIVIESGRVLRIKGVKLLASDTIN